jgi:type II secretory pathway pseudopilin PulG
MSTTYKAGFTIIETMLFLAITGLLIAAMLVGVGTSINNQRYRDSVTSLQSFLQSQYSSISNVQNDRDNSWKCDSSAISSQTGALQNRGQSNCVLLGRYITIVEGNTTVATVLGYQTATASGTDIANLKASYTLGLSAINQQTDSLAWGTVIAWPVSGQGFQKPTTPRSIAILIVRSPDSGSIYTFTSDTPPLLIANVKNKDLQAMLVTGTGLPPSQEPRTLCIDAQGLQGLVASNNSAVYMHAYANGPTSIETRSNDIATSVGATSRC